MPGFPKALQTALGQSLGTGWDMLDITGGWGRVKRRSALVVALVAPHGASDPPVAQCRVLLAMTTAPPPPPAMWKEAQASALTATELTTSRNQDFGVWKWGQWGKWRKTGGNAGKWGIAGIAHGTWAVKVCGGMWLRKMGRKWDEMPIFSPISPVFPEVEDLPQSSLPKKAVHRQRIWNVCPSPTLPAAQAPDGRRR